ncbi:MAG: DUF1700 domain-containing protein [Bacillota bacterium]|nr:DUF1700 domain-containing protein [Bacillota bacterium]
MGKTEFMSKLAGLLDFMSEEDRRDILYDYEEHFRAGAESGKTEEEIAESLGDPRLIANQYKLNYIVRQPEPNTYSGSTMKSIIAALGLGFFNLVVMTGPFFGILGTLIGLFAAGIGIAISGVAAILSIVLLPNVIYIPDSAMKILRDINPGVYLFSGIGLICLGLLFIIGISYLFKYFFKGTIAYLNWNMNIIKK